MSWQRHLPNVLTGLRILLVWPTFTAVLQQRHGDALGLLAAGAVTDLLDGWLAKRFGWQTQLGALLDPLADKLMFGGVFLALMLADRIPVWFGVVVLLRDAVIVAGAAAFRLLVGPFAGGATGISKLNTLLLVAYALYVLIAAIIAGNEQPPAAVAAAATVLGAGAFATTVLSGVHYVTVWARRAIAALGRRSGAAAAAVE